MRYLFAVTDLVPSLPALSGLEARLAAVLARPRVIALICIAGLTALGWLALGIMAAGPSFGWAALCQPQASHGWAAFGLALPMWMAMVLAMMLPTAGPMILTYAEIADTGARKAEPVVSPTVLAAGYLVVWLGFAVAAACAQSLLAAVGLVQGDRVGGLFAGIVFVGAGLYQFSALKRACLTQCQRPFPFLFANWTTERAGVLRLGLRQGLHCVGCCWAMMLLMLTFGTMNVVWMALLGVVMTLEKLSSGTRVSAATGIALVAAGVVMIAFGWAAWT